MAWRLAKSLEILRSQVNAKYPSRSKNSDGSIGDESHSARTSDHNPDDSGVVRAIDITHDPHGGFDSYVFADMLLKKQDKRLKYVISNRRIGSGPAGPMPGVWRPYSGKNPHDHHCHISVVADGRGDDTSQWDINGNLMPPADAKPYVVPPPTLRKGAKGEDVEKLQGRLNAHGAELKIDGDFGEQTANAVMLFQTMHDLPRDGIVGPMTHKALSQSAA